MLKTLTPSWARSENKAWALLVILAVCVPLFFFRLGAWGFFDPDEGRYGEIPRAMLDSGDFVTPMVNGVDFFDKPPLLYWLIAASYRVFGFSEGAARLIPALAALGAVWGAWLLGRRMFGPRAGLMAGAILASCVVWPLMARVVLTDMLVSSLVFLALAFWWMGRSESLSTKSHGAKSDHTPNFNKAMGHTKTGRLWFFGFWTALALGVLAKGPVTLVLAVGSISLYLLLTKEWAVLKRMGWGSGLLWGLLITVPWFVLVAQRNPEFNHAFWFEQHLGRFTGTLDSQDHDNGPLYFLEFLPLIFFPWTAFAPAAIAAGWRKIWGHRIQGWSEKERAALFLVCGGFFVVLFFSGSRSKLVTYILPVVPLMAIALAGYFDWVLQQPERWNRALRVEAMALSGFLIVGAIAGAVAGPKQLQKIDVPGTIAIVLSVVLLLWGVSLFWASRKFRLQGVVPITVGGFCTVFALGTGILQAAGGNMTTPRLIGEIRPGLGAKTEIVSLGLIQSLSFYTGKRVTVVGNSDELRSGIANLSPIERDRWFLDESAEVREFADKRTPVYFVMRNVDPRSKKYRKFMKMVGEDVDPITRNTRYTIMGNEAARAITPPDASIMGSHFMPR